MDNRMQKREELQDEEIYALLDKAMEDERLCVSEALIQKTLQRVKEESEAEVIPVRKRTGKTYRIMQYTGVVAAAALLLIVGSRVLSGTGGTSERAQMDAVQDNSVRSYEKSAEQNGIGEVVTDGMVEFEYSSMADSVMAQSTAQQEAAVEPAEEPKSEKEIVYRGVSVEITNKLQEVIAAVVGGQATGNAECWEFVHRETDWQEELLHQLESGTYPKDALLNEGTYGYELLREDGSVFGLMSEEPLDVIVGIRTEQGTVWCLLGKQVRLYLE